MNSRIHLINPYGLSKAIYGRAKLLLCLISAAQQRRPTIYEMGSRLHPLVSATRILIFTICGSFSIAASATTNSWVYFDSSGHLKYRTWSGGNRIMDFSSAGYMGGGVAIPDVATVVTVNPSGGDDTAAIKSAISTAASQSLVNGIRGAVQLARGTFHVSSQININASGVVVRGAGSANGTTIVMTGSTPFKLFNMSGSGSPSQSGTVNMTDSYVASGATGFNVSSASGFSVGDNVLIHRVVTTSWINFMGMQPGGSGGLDSGQTWISAGTDITTDRKISAISGNHITLDVPLTDSFDTTYLGSPAGKMSKYSWSGRISQVGLEHLRIQAPAANEAYISVYLDSIIDSWVRDVTIQDGVNSFTVQNGSKRITVDSVNITRTVAISSSAPPWDFSCDGTQVLFNKCQSSGTGVWPFITQGESTGPIVLLNFSTTENGGISPHQRWSTGVLADNCSLPNAPSGTQGISYRNRANHGSGQGWTTGWSVAWNVTTPFFLVSAAPGTENWCIGGIGAKTSTSDPDGIYDQLGSIVTPNSLYLEQLRERLGDQALENIGYGSIDATAIYQIQNEASGLVLNNQGRLTNGAPITQYSSVSSDNLRWTFIPTDSGYYQINSVKSGLDAVVQSASTAQGAGIIQWSFGSAQNDQWLPQQNSDGSYTFVNRHSGLVLEDPASSISTSTQTDQWGANGGANQKWKLIKQ
jgi:hypothetical protein